VTKYKQAPDFEINNRIFILKRTKLISRFNDKLDFLIIRSYYEIVKNLGNDLFRCNKLLG